MISLDCLVYCEVVSVVITIENGQPWSTEL